ncbi:MAG TPA: sigma 54-interacting transcriptional regulator [Gemmataceae bacterium]|jgi:transcriptional regulator with GAF, ATPase, and Fis domain
MRRVLLSAWNEIRFLPRRMTALFAGAASLARNTFHDKSSRRRLAILVASILVCAYTLGVSFYVMLTPDIGVRCAFFPVVNQFNDDFLFQQGDFQKDTKAYQLEQDDQIVRLGDRPVSNWAQILHKLVRLRPQDAEKGTLADLEPDSGEKSAPPRKTHLVVEDQEVIWVRFVRPSDPPGPEGKPAERTVWLRVGRPPLETLAPSVLWFFLKIGLFVVGAIVFWKRPEDRSATQFFLFCLVSFGAYTGGYHWHRLVTQPALILVFMICSILLPAVSLHFYLVFPRPKAILDRAPRRVLTLLYGPPVFFLLLLISGYIRIQWQYNVFRNPDVQFLLDEMLFEIYCYFGVAALWYLASVVGLVHSYRTAVGATERNQVKWILFGTLASLAPIGYSLYLALAERQRFGGGAATWPMFFASLCVTVAFTISITRYRLMQIDQLISSGVVYFLFSSVVGLVYYGLVFTGMVLLGSHVVEEPSLGQVVAMSSTVLVLLFGRDLVRDRLTSALNRHFHREKHQLDRTLQRMSQAIEQLVDPPALAHRLLHTSAELLGAGVGAVYLRRGDPPLYLLTESVGPAPALAELSSGCPLVESLLGHNLLALPTQTPPNTAGQRQLHFLGGTIAQGLFHEGQLLGILTLGAPAEPRGLATEMSGGYTAEDLHLLTAFAQMTVLALVSAEGHRKIDTLNRELQTKVEKIAEQQRRIMALQNQLSAVRHPPAALGEPRAAQSEPQTADAGGPTADGFIGSSAKVHHLMQLVRKVSPTDSVVLLRGESGTGKELLARAIHDNSPRANKPFVAVHCSALSPSLLESELFGHVKGAFTNAIRDKIGRFEAANGGTLFLDEIGDINVEVQIKLLRVLQERTFERVGSSEPLKVDVRIITATHQDLKALMRQGRFREDLFFRLDVLPIVLPPLRDRAEDIPELVLHFLRMYSQRMNRQVTGIDDDAMARLKAYPWPGNIRQLENYIQRAVVVAERSVVTVDELPAELQADPFQLATLTYRPSHPNDGGASFQDADDLLDETLSEAGDHWSPLLAMPSPQAGIIAPPSSLTAAIQSERGERDRREREVFVRALAAAGGNKAEAARALGMARSTFISRLKRLGLT